MLCEFNLNRLSYERKRKGVAVVVCICGVVAMCGSGVVVVYGLCLYRSC